MRQPLVIGNWKSNKSIEETHDWLLLFKEKCEELGWSDPENMPTCIICVPFPLLPVAKEYIDTHHLPLSLGVQDISPYGEGAYTGEVNAQLAHEFASYVLIGHAERRKYFHETEQELAFELLEAKTHELTPIFCTPSENESIPQSADIVAYEPTFAIGTGTPDTPEHALMVGNKIRAKISAIPLLYGGSVYDDATVKSFCKLGVFDGFLLGTASLDPVVFVHIAEIMWKEQLCP